MKFCFSGPLAAPGWNVPGFRITLLILVSLSSLKSYAQKEAEIVKKFRVALRDCVLDVPEPPIVAKGLVIMGNIKFTGTQYYHKPNSRMELTFQGATFIRLDNDTINWEYNPLENRHAVKKTDPIAYQARIKKDIATDFASKELRNYKTLKNVLKFKGEQRVDSIDTYILELTVKDSDLLPITFYLDKRTNLIYQCEIGSEKRWYSNYKVFGNYIFPTSMVLNDGNMKMEMHFNDITIGTPIPDSLFIVPKEVFANVSAFDRKIQRILMSADSLLTINQADAAVTQYNEVIKLEGNNFLAYNGRGLAKVNQQKYYEAIADLNIAIEINRNGARAYNNRGLAKFYLGDNKGSLDDYNEALRLDTTLVTAYKNRGLLLLRNEKYEEARDDYFKAKTLRPADGDSYLKYGVSMAQLGHYEEALKSYHKAAELNTVTDELYNYRGVSEFKLQKYKEAVVSFQEAVNKSGDNLQYLENLGNAFYYAGDFKRAETEFERYLQKDESNAEIHNMVGLCKYQDEDYKGSIKKFTKAIELNGESAVYYSNRALAKESVEDYQGAISDYTESISRNPTDASNFYYRGLVKILTSKKLEGCMDLGTAKDMKYEGAEEAIMKNCN